MPVIKYTGTQSRWPELSVTGRQSVWSPGQMEDRSASEAQALIAAGGFELVGGTLVVVPISAAELAAPSEATLRNVNAIYRTIDGSQYQSNGATIRPFSGSSLTGAAEDLTISAGSFTFTGPAGRYSLNHQSVLYPLIANMPGFGGARPVVNWFLNSSTPGSPTAWDTATDGLAGFSASTDTYNGASIGVLAVTNSASAGGPYERGYAGNVNGASLVAAPYGPGQWAAVNAWPPGAIMAMRMLARGVSAAATWAIYQRARDDALAPTESLPGDIALTTSFQVITATMEQNAAYTALGTRINLKNSGNDSANLAQIQIENVTGDKDPLIPSEYVPSGATPQWKWFDTAKAASRTNSSFTANWAALVPLKAVANALSVAGVLTDATGATLTGLTGILSEPAASNICGGWNTLANIGHGKGSGQMQAPCTNGVAPFRSGVTTAQIECYSNMLVGNFNGTSPTDITLTFTGVNDTINSTTTNFLTAGVFVGMTLYVWRNDVQAFGNLPVSAVTATQITLTGTFFGSTKASGVGTRIFRMPGNGDNIMLMLNDGTGFRTTVNGAPTVPTAAQFNASSKSGYVITLAAAPGADGGYANTDNGTKCYFWKNEVDFGITIAGGTGATAKPVFDRTALIAAGLGHICPMGIVLELNSGTSGSPTFTLGATAGLGVASRDTQVSTWNKRISGSWSVKLESHGTTTALADAAWTKRTVQQASAGTQCRPAIVGPSGGSSILYVILWATEQAAAAAGVAVNSSPIVTYGATAAVSRVATRCTRPWAGTAKNNISRSITWTPTQGSLTDSSQKQTLWSLYADASNYLELSITGTTVTWRKRRGGTNFDVTASFTPVPGVAVALVFAARDTTGLTLSINGTAATPSTADLFDITALTPAAAEEIGSLNAASVAHGYFRALGVT